MARDKSSEKPLVWLRGEIKTPPFSSEARTETGFLLRRLQRGDALGLPVSRPMPDIGPNCHELRIVDGTANWRIVYHIAADAVVVLDVFAKKTAATPKTVMADCGRRLVVFQKIVSDKTGVRDARR